MSFVSVCADCSFVYREHFEREKGCRGRKQLHIVYYTIMMIARHRTLLFLLFFALFAISVYMS